MPPSPVTPHTAPIEVVAFDLMDTLVHDPWREALRAAFGDRLEAAMRERSVETWPAFEAGHITEDEFWAAHAAFDPDPEACRAVRVARTRWLPGMRELVDDVRAAGRDVVIATNYPTWIEDIEDTLLAGVADELVASCRIGVRKPDADFYVRTAEAVGRPAQRAVFVDDRERNVDGARAVGMAGIVFSDATAVRRDLEALGALG